MRVKNYSKETVTTEDLKRHNEKYSDSSEESRTPEAILADFQDEDSAISMMELHYLACWLMTEREQFKKALEEIDSFDADPFLHNHANPAMCAICVAKRALGKEE